MHAKFDAYYDKDAMADKMDTRWFDPAHNDRADQIDYSEDFSDMAEDLQYKRYKIQQREFKDNYKEHVKKIKLLEAEAAKARPNLTEQDYLRDADGNLLSKNI